MNQTVYGKAGVEQWRFQGRVAAPRDRPLGPGGTKASLSRRPGAELLFHRKGGFYGAHSRRFS